MATSSTEIPAFHWADYLIFSLVLVISGAIGFFTAFKHRKATSEQLLTGNRKLPLIPVVMSLTTSFFSAISVLGVPAETYYNGNDYWMIGLSYIPSQIITCVVMMPIIYRLKVTSGYQYLEYRFNRTVRLLGSLAFTLLMILYMAVVLYAPSLALSQVTNLSMDVSILATGLICTFYTALGGIKAVVWTDAFQTTVIMAGFVALMARGSASVGGWSEVMDRAFEGRRFNWEVSMDLDPFVRHTFWTQFVGGGFISLSVYAANQAMLQRYIGMPSLKQARWVIMLHLLLSEIFLGMLVCCGFVLYAYYYHCDPISDGLIKKADQLIPLFVMQVLGDYPGLPGLFVACVYSAALSTVSSGVNSLAAVMLEDFLNPCIIKKGQGKDLERIKSIVTIVSAVVFGLATIGLAYMAGVVGQAVLQVALSILGMVGGPLLGVFILGMFMPCVNSWGAGIGLITSLVVSMWTAIGAIVNKIRSASPSLPPLRTDMCMKNINDTLMTTMSTASSFNFSDTATTMMTTAAAVSSGRPEGVNYWYSLSYQHYATISVIVSVIVGFLVSAVTGFNKNREVDKRTYVDVMACFTNCKNEDFNDGNEKGGVENGGFDMSKTDGTEKKTTVTDDSEICMTKL